MTLRNFGRRIAPAPEVVADRPHPGAALMRFNRPRARGVAPLRYDAYEVNGLPYCGTSLALTGTTNAWRQRMILKARPAPAWEGPTHQGAAHAGFSQADNYRGKTEDDYDRPATMGAPPPAKS